MKMFESFLRTCAFSRLYIQHDKKETNLLKHHLVARKLRVS
jgi:hypothetical protein